MKITKIILSAIGAAAVMNLAAFAGDLVPVQVPNGHGQITVLYRSSTPTIAVFSGRGVGTTSTGQLVPVQVSNGHGQSVTLYRAQ